MILGIGNDLIDIRRIEQTLDRFGDRFINRIFTETERKSPTKDYCVRQLRQTLRLQGGLLKSTWDRLSQGGLLVRYME